MAVPKLVQLLIGVSRVVPRAATAPIVDGLTKQTKGPGYAGMMARDQHQPASSRATATLATVGRLRRCRKVTQRACKRRLP